MLVLLLLLLMMLLLLLLLMLLLLLLLMLLTSKDTWHRLLHLPLLFQVRRVTRAQPILKYGHGSVDSWARGMIGAFTICC